MTEITEITEKTEHPLQDTKHELSLWELCLICCRAIGRFFNSLWQVCLNSLRLALQRWYIVLPFIILGLVGGLYFSRKANRIYNVGAMVHLSGVNRTDVNRLYTSLCSATPDYINTQQTLASLLQITPEQAAKLRKFKTCGVIDFQNDSIPDVIDKKNKHDLSDTVTVIMPNYLYLSFQTKAPQEAQLIGEAIINYLNHDASLQTAFAAHKQVLQRKVDFCRTQVDKLDSLTTTFYFEQTGKGQMQYNRWSSALVVGERSIELLHPDILHLIRDLEFVEKQFTMATAPVVPMGQFVVEPRPINGFFKCSILGIFLGYIVGCLCAFAWKKRKHFTQWLKEE